MRQTWTHRKRLSRVAAEIRANLAFYLIPQKDKKKPGTKKRRKKKEMRIDEKTGKEEEVELEEFVYDWKTCCCGISHPPIPDFDPPRPKRCNYYWVNNIVVCF